MSGAAGCGVRSTMPPSRTDPTCFGCAGIRHVELLHLAGAPAGHVEEPVVDREVDVGDDRRHRGERLQRGRQQVRVGGLGGDGDDLLGLPLVAVAEPAPDRAGQVLGGDHDADEAPGRLGVVGRADLQRHLVLGAQVDALQVLTRGEVPEVDGVPVLLAQQQLRHDPVLDHRRAAPLAGDQHVLVEVPPGVVVEVLRPAVGLPGAQDVEGLVVEQRDPARSVVVALGAAQAGQEDPVRSAVQGVRAGVAGLRGERLARRSS